MTDERAKRFTQLITEIEDGAKKIRLNQVVDIPLFLYALEIKMNEARKIATDVSREALRKLP